MDGNRISTSFDETREVMMRTLNHKMNIERKFRVLSYRRDHGWPERNVIDEMAVHDVEVEPIRTGFLDATNLNLESGEVGREQGWGDEDF
jgi:hypothetical protein